MTLRDLKVTNPGTIFILSYSVDLKQTVSWTIVFITDACEFIVAVWIIIYIFTNNICYLE